MKREPDTHNFSCLQPAIVTKESKKHGPLIVLVNNGTSLEKKIFNFPVCRTHLPFSDSETQSSHEII